MTTLITAFIKQASPPAKQAHDEAVEKVFTALARLEQILGQHKHSRATSVDREAISAMDDPGYAFDPVYVTHFKCDKYRISDY